MQTGADWVANSPCLRGKQGLSAALTGAVGSLDRGCLRPQRCCSYELAV